MPKRELPSEVAARIDQIVEDFKKSLSGLFRFHGMDTIDAVCELLEEAGNPLTLPQLLQELKAGGIAMVGSASPGGPDADLLRSIGYYTARKLKIQQVGEYIGRADWDLSRFPKA